MGDRHCGRKPCKRSAERTRCVALDDEERRPVGEQRGDGAGDLAGMDVRIGTARLVKRGARISVEPMLWRSERMLTGEDQSLLKAGASQCRGDGG
jgi:hypothetical protein